MVTHEDLIRAREALLERTVAFFTEQPEVIGIVLAGSLAAGSADAYSDIDLRTIATPEGQTRLLARRLEWPARWGELLFNEWLNGTQHCVSHFRPFLKIDVFYLSPQTFVPSPWLRLPEQILLDRTGVIREVLETSQSLSFPAPEPVEVSRILSKALAAAHETVRRARRGELIFAQSLLEEMRSFMIRLDGWLHAADPVVSADLKLDHRASGPFKAALEESYAQLDGAAIEAAAVDLSAFLARQIPLLHQRFRIGRPLSADLEAVDLVRLRRVAT
jgi:predicted nucleotidyltransferase